MKIIGITGGVGSGKSEVLRVIEELYSCTIIRADELAKSLERKGEVCYEPLINLLGEKILDANDEIDSKKMAKAIFEADSNDLLLKVNNIIHPEVKTRIKELISLEKEKNEIDFFFIEAALLIEEHYELICDELWYIYADKDIRISRLKESRGYSDEKIKGIMDSQLDEGTFRKYCKVVVNNSGTLEATKKQIIDIIDKERV